jgi:hypothetical protein
MSVGIPKELYTDSSLAPRAFLQKETSVKILSASFKLFIIKSILPVQRFAACFATEISCSVENQFCTQGILSSYSLPLLVGDCSLPIEQVLFCKTSLDL